MRHVAFVNPIRRKVAALQDLTDVFSPISVIPAQNKIPVPCFYLKIRNRSNYAVYISFDGATIHDYIPIYSNLEIDTMFNKQKLVTPLFQQDQIVYAAVVGFPFIVPPTGFLDLTGFSSFI
jgi:hypothetical protein